MEEEGGVAAAAAAVPEEDYALYRKYVMFPVKDLGALQGYKKQIDCFWRVEDFTHKLAEDEADWAHRLTPGERTLMSMVLAFFAASDGIVSENLVARFCLESDLAEVRAFYTVQAFFEQIHSETYSILIDRLVPSVTEKAKLFRAVEHHECVRRKAEWGRRWVNCADDAADPCGPARRLAAFACVEGIFFSSSFATIFWFRSRNLLPGTTASNEWISRDEALHTEFAAYRYRQLPPEQQMSTADLYALVDEAVQIEIFFVQESLPSNLPGMNAELMTEHVKCVADVLLALFGLPPAYGCACPFPFMAKQASFIKSNFFEMPVSNYSAAVLSVQEDTYNALAIEDGDF